MAGSHRRRLLGKNMSGHRIDVRREGYGFAVTVDGDSPRACADIAGVVAVVSSVMPGRARSASANGSVAHTDPQGDTAVGNVPDAAA